MLRSIICYFLLLSLMGWIAGFAYFMNLISQPCHTDLNINTEGIIVLTGGKNRIETGLELLKKNSSKRLFISGVNSKIEKIMSVIKIFSSISIELENRIEFGRMATSTFENAIETKEWIELNNINSITLVTSNYHTPRSLLVFKNEMPNISIESYTVCAKEIAFSNLWNDPKCIGFFLKEYAKYSAVIIQTCTKRSIKELYEAVTRSS